LHPLLWFLPIVNLSDSKKIFGLIIILLFYNVACFYNNKARIQGRSVDNNWSWNFIIRRVVFYEERDNIAKLL